MDGGMLPDQLISRAAEGLRTRLVIAVQQNE